MTPAALSAAQSVLLARVKELRVRLRTLDVPATNGHGDEGDRAVTESTREESFGTLDRLAIEIGECEAALARMEEGTWGTCLDCDGEIAPKRLAKVPEAARCVPCQERREFAQTRLGRGFTEEDC
jgi:DnaK suppressor protein